MAQIFLPPAELGPEPTFSLDFKSYGPAEIEYVTKVKSWAKKNGSGSCRGEEIRFPVADGHARYVVFSLKPVTLIHLRVGEGLEYRHAKFLPASEIRLLVEQALRWKAVFSRKAS
jgi:hypothetical protein